MKPFSIPILNERKIKLKNSSGIIEKQDNLDELKYKLEIEHLISSISRVFVNATISEIDHLIQSGLRSFVQLANVDRGYIYMFHNNNKRLELTYQFNQTNIKGKVTQHDQVDGEDFSWLLCSLMDKKSVSIMSISQLPPEASTIRLIMQSEKTKSMIFCPLILNTTAVGFIGLDTVKDEREFSDDIEYLLRICGDVFVRAIDRKRSVEGSKQSEEKLRLLFDRIQDGIFVSTPTGKFLEINPAGVKMLGYPSEAEVMALDIERDLYENPEERINFARILEKEGHIKDYEVTLKCRDGKIIKVLITATAVRDKRGKIEAHEGIIRDITEKFNLEEQLFQSQKMESIGILAGGIAHDFNNILTAINGNAELILMNLDSSSPLHKYIVSILKGGKRAEGLIRHLLAFSRKQLIKLQVVDINFEINELYKMLDRLISEDISLELKLKDGLSPIKSDVTQIQQILVNLVVNAGHAIQDTKNKTKQNSIPGTFLFWNGR